MKLKLISNEYIAILISASFIIVLGCKPNKERENKLLNKDNIQTIFEMKNKIHYGISLNLYFPFELYINDIKVEYGARGGGMMADINPWIFKTSKINLRLSQNKYDSDPSFDMQAWGLQHMEIYKWLVDENNVAINSSFEEVMKLPIRLIDKGLVSYTQEWEIEIKDLPYELEGWRNGQDLSKWNKDVLQKKVVAYYEKLQTILNNGDVDTWMKLTEKRRYETKIFNYTSEDKTRKKNNENSKKIQEECKGNMLPLENYEMKIYGKNNQLVCLERIATNDFEEWEETGEGWSPLITIFDEDYIRDYPVKLYLPKDSNEFVIIRK